MSSVNTIEPAKDVDAKEVVGALMEQARAAQGAFESATQELVDEVVTAVAWAGYKPENAAALASLAVEDTGLGNVPDKIAKIQRKTMGTLRDLEGARSVGVIREDPEMGITEIAKPMGVVAALIPSTNPAATTINKTMMILKGRNAVIVAPSPKGARTCELAAEFIRQELGKVGVPLNLIQCLPRPLSKEMTAALMRQADFVVVTGSQSNVRAAYSSGTPAIGVGAGNVPVIMDDTADLEDAAAKIKRSKVFDHATSCSSENSVLIQEDIYPQALDALRRQGGYLLSPQEKEQLQRLMFGPNGKLTGKVTAQPPETIARLAGFHNPEAYRADFFMVEEEGIGPEYPFSGEKLSVVLTVYKFKTFEEALEKVQRLLDYQGAGHSVGIHSKNEQHIQRLAHTAKVARVLVNQAHAFGNGGSFDNGLGFTLTMGAGTWAGNSISENLSYKHFLNTTRLARVIPPRVPTEEQLWGQYVAKHGR